MLLVPFLGLPSLMPAMLGIITNGPGNLLTEFLFALVFLNAILMIFNLIPIPPLDGSKFLFEILPDRYNHIKEQLTRNGMWILFGLIFLSSFLGISVFGFIFDFSRWVALLWI